MDPLADKILVISALLALTLSPFNYIHFLIFVIILLREIAVTILRNYYIKKKIYIAANIWGKIKTTMQMIGIIGAFLYKSFETSFAITHESNEKIILVIQIYFWLVALVTLISGMNYFLPAKKTVKT